MRIYVKKNVEVQTEMTPEDMGRAFANADAVQQFHFLKAITEEFNEWDIGLPIKASHRQMCSLAEVIANNDDGYIKGYIKTLLEFIELQERKV